MDDNARRRRNEPPLSSTPNPRYPVHDPNAQRRPYAAGATSGASDNRYRPAPLNTSSTAARSMGAATYSYQDQFSTAMQQNTLPYQSEYGQDTRQQTQTFSTYNPSMMYNVPQAGAQYDAQQFPQRQPAALQIIAADVAAPYFPGEGSASAMQPQAASSSTSAAVYQQSPALHNYPSGMTMSGMAQPSAPDQVVEEQEYSASAEMGEAYEQYQSALKEIFSNIRNGVLLAASESLLNVSDWLLSKVADLGLAGDNPQLHSDRIKLWHDFNHAWLSLFQKQKDMVESGVPLQRGQTLITEEGLKKMGKEIVRLCDGIERHGLVDYEYGVWEEPIVAIIEECLDLYENSDEAGGVNPGGSSHIAGR